MQGRRLLPSIGDGFSVATGAPKSNKLIRQSDGSFLGPEHIFSLPLDAGVIRSKKGSVVLSKQQGVATMFDLINQPKWDDRPCLGTLTDRGNVEQGQLGSWRYQTYGQVKQQSRQFASGLKSMNVFNAGERLGIWLSNSPEWMVVDIACTMYSVVSVSLYDTLGESQACRRPGVPVGLHRELHGHNPDEG